MDAEQIQQLRPRLDAYLREFDDCFARCEPVAHLEAYVMGQLSDLPRKSIEPIADAAGQEPRTLQQFLAVHEWDHARVRDLLQQRVARDHPHACSIGVIDETGHPKKGVKTPGVQRQWCGRLGKVENCVVTVHLAYAAGDFHCLVDSALFLPKSWAEDRERCRLAKIPDDLVHRPKWQIALELRDRAVGNGINLAWVTFDENYPMNPEFLFALDDRGQHYIGEVKRTFTGWLTPPALLYKRPPGAKGRSGYFPRLKKKNAAPISVENMLRHSPGLRKIPWEKFHIKDSEKGPVVWEAKAVPIYLKRDGLPTWPHWLVVARDVENLKVVKFFIAHAPAGTPLEVLLHVAFSRWHVERCFQDEKSQLGLSHFEVRNYQSLERHLIVTSLSFLFLAEVHHELRGEKSGPDRLPGAHGQCGADLLPVGVRPRPPEIPRADGGPHRRDAKPKPTSTEVPCESQTQAVA